MFEFAWPWICVLFPLPWLLRRLLPAATPADAALRLPVAGGLDELARNFTASPGNLKLLLMWLVWSLLLAAAARPQWVGEAISIPVTGRDLMLAVDISGSMNREDMTIEDKVVTRLELVKHVLADFVVRRKGDRIGLILFGSNAYLQAPLTFDSHTVGQLLQETPIGIAGGKTAIGDAIGLTIKNLQQRPAESRVLILLTDGANNSGNMPPGRAATLAKQAQVTIYTVGVGAEQMRSQSWFGGVFGTQTLNPSAELDEQTLRQIAEETGGDYFRARNQQELESIYATLNELEPVQAPEEMIRPTLQLFYWPLAAALLLSFLLAALPANLARRTQLMAPQPQ